MSTRPFDLDHALKNWKARYPDRMERIKHLRFELYDCRDIQPVTIKGAPRLRGYPETAKCIEEMLEALGASLS